MTVKVTVTVDEGEPVIAEYVNKETREKIGREFTVKRSRQFFIPSTEDLLLRERAPHEVDG